MSIGIPSTGIPYRFPSSASPGHATGLTENVSPSIPNSQIEIEMVVLAVQVAEQQQLFAFASASAVVVVVEFELPEFAPMQYVFGPEASLPVAALDQVWEHRLWQWLWLCLTLLLLCRHSLCNRWLS